MKMGAPVRVALLVLSVAAACTAILPEIAQSGVSHILQDTSAPTDLDRVFVQVEQLPEDKQGQQEEKEGEGVTSQQETNHIPPTSVQPTDAGNQIDHACVSTEDCGKGRYCLSQNSKCLPCKSTDVPCSADEQCCGEQLCVWGQCAPNATRGDAGSTCRSQSDCGPDLCCALHTALLFPVCSAKPIERERCFVGSNHLMELLSWDRRAERPRKHCPCAGGLHCQHLGRGSMCLKREAASEEDMTDSIYSEIDYII